MKTRLCWIALSAALVASPITAQPVTGSPWGSRPPLKCAPLTKPTPPTPAQIIQILRCAKESGSSSSGELWLMEDVTAQIGGPMPFRALYNIIVMADADTTKPVYPIRGSWTWSICILRADAKIGGGDPNQNCRETPVTGATGACWRTTFADWKCAMNGTSGETRRPTRPRTTG